MNKVLSKGSTAGKRPTVEEMLRRCEVDEQLTWEEFATACDIELRSVRAVVHAARMRVQSQGLFFKTVRGFGVQRISHDQVVEHTLPELAGSIQRRARKLHTTVSDLDLEKLSSEHKIMAVGYASTAALVAAAAKPKEVRTLGASQDVSQIARDSLKKFR